MQVTQKMTDISKINIFHERMHARVLNCVLGRYDRSYVKSKVKEDVELREKRESSSRINRLHKFKLNCV